MTISNRRDLTWIRLAFILFFAAISAAGCELHKAESEGEKAVPGSDAQGGSIVVRAETIPAGQPGTFGFTGVPTGTISMDSTLVISDLQPGTYTTTQRDPAPDFDVSGVACDDGDSSIPSSGDAASRTAVINLDQGETVTCVFTNTRRGTLVIAGRTVPEGSPGNMQFTGVPTGTIPANGTLVVSELVPGTYSSTQVDPAPVYDLTDVSCDDGGSPTPSGGDASSRTAIFNLDPGETITCTFVNTLRGAAVIQAVTAPEGTEGVFMYTGVPTGTVSSSGTLATADLPPGTYTSTEVDPSPEFEITEVVCDDAGSAVPSAGDPSTRTAVFNIDPGETVTCTFVHSPEGASPPGDAGGGQSGGAGGAGDGRENGATDPGLNPFSDPQVYLQDFPLQDFPLPKEIPPDAGTYPLPLEGTWSVTHFEGIINCGFEMAIPASPPETGVLTLSDDGQEIVGSGLEAGQGVDIVLAADPDITGRYVGRFDGTAEGAPVTIFYHWQVVRPEFIIGYLTSSYTSGGTTCTVYRPFAMTHIDG